MTPSEFKAAFEQRHREAEAEFGAPEVVLPMVPTWHCEAVVDRVTDLDNLTYIVENPVPVYSGQDIVGHANLSVAGTAVKADIFVDYNTPERLDVETGKDIYAMVRAEINQEYTRHRDGIEALPGAEFRVTGLELTTSRQDRGEALIAVQE